MTNNFHIFAKWQLSVNVRRYQLKGGNVDEEEEIVDDPPPPMPHKDALMHLSMVRKYLEENFTDFNAFYEIENMIEKNVYNNRTQHKMTDFFSKK